MDNKPKNLTYHQLWNIAKERKIKYYKRHTKNQLEKILGFEITKPNENYEKYCREKMKKPIPVIAINSETGETLNFKSLVAAANKFNMKPGSIKYRIIIKKDLVINGKKFLVFYDHVGI